MGWMEHLGRARTAVGAGAPVEEPDAVHIRVGLRVLIAIALAVRLLQAWRGLPYLHVWDEPFVVSKALDMLKHGTLDPASFVYGTLPTYMTMAVAALHYLWLMGRPETAPPFLSHIDQITTYDDTGWLWEISHPSFYLWSRWLAALIGAATVLLVFLIARRLAGRWAGLAAAAFLAFQPFHIEQSAIATVDNPMTFFVVLAAWGAIEFLDQPRSATLLISLVACGLAASCKYTAALSVIMPVLALSMTAHRLSFNRRWLFWLAAPLLPAAGFLAGTPYAILTMRPFLIDVGMALRVYVATPMARSRVEPGLAHLWLQAESFARGVGPGALLIIMMGALLLASRRRGWILLAYAFAHALFMSGTSLGYHRNFLVLYPIAAVAMGAGAAALMSMMNGLSAGADAGAAHGARRYIPTVGAAGVILVIVWPAPAVARTGYGHYTVAESRTTASILAARAVEEEPGLRVAAAAELRIHRDDLARIGARVEVVPFIDLICPPSEAHDLILVPARWAAYAEPRRWRAGLFSRLEPGGVIESRRVGADPLYLDAPSWNPAVALVSLRSGEEAGEGGDAADGGSCLATFRPSEMAGSLPVEIAGSGELVILRNSHVSTEWVYAGRGDYSLVVEARGSRANGAFSRVRLTALGYIAGGEEEALASAEFDLAADSDLRALTFTVPAGAVVAGRVEFINDWYSEERQQGRDVWLMRAMILSLGDVASRPREPPGRRYDRAP